MARKVTITLKPKFGPPPGSRVVGWEVSDGKNVAVNTAKEDGQKAWGKAIQDHQAAGYEVTAEAYGADGRTVEAKGIYYPNGSMKDLGGQPASKGGARRQEPVMEALPAAPRTRKPASSAALPPPPKPAAQPRKPKASGGEKSQRTAEDKPKRKPSEYNQFIARRIPKLIEQGHDRKTAISEAAAEWRAKKGQ